MENFSFKEFVHANPHYEDAEILSMYLYGKQPVREISRQTGKSIGEIYRILRRQYSEPNRRAGNHGAVIALADSGMPVNTIADFTGYTARHVRNIIKK